MKEEETSGRLDELSSCNIIYDLLPLYIDGICSEESRKLVDKHLNECPACKEKYAAMTEELTEVMPAAHVEQGGNSNSRSADRSAAQILGRIRRRWLIALIAILFAIPLMWLSVNQFREEGVSFTNLYDYYSAGRYVAALQQGDFEKAFGYIDVAKYYEMLQRDKEAAYSASINREDFQQVSYEDGRQEYTNGELAIPAEDFEQWLVNAEQELLRLREWYEQSPYVGMSYEEFYKFSKQNYIQNLQEWKALGYTLKGRGVTYSYKSDSGLTSYNYGIQIIADKHQAENGSMALQGNGKGKFVHVGGWHDPGETLISDFGNRLSIWE